MIDISKDALVVARENAEELECDVNIIQSDLFQSLNKKYDVIISNPPYIKSDEKIEDIVYNNEPHLALYGGIDGLDVYKKIRNNLENHVNDKFILALEIGYDEKDDVINLFSDMKDVSIICKKDLSRFDRMIFVIRDK